jgi:hypothetical protein
MAEILISSEKSNLSSLWKFLSGFLPDDTQIIVGPSPKQHPLDAIIISPRSISVLFIRDWEGEVHPQKDKPWVEYLKSSSTIYHSGIIGETEAAKEALQAFLLERFPLIKPAINQYIVLINPHAKLIMTESVWPKPVSPFSLLKALQEDSKTIDPFLADRKNREELANSLLDRQSASSNKSKKPFIFHSRGFIERSKRVWTIQEAIQHIYLHLEEGADPLRNGSLAQWFKEAGAEPLAQLALEVMKKNETDSRILVEDFLIDTGLVQRPGIWFFPRILNFGYILSGQSKTRRFYILRGLRRGYLYGKIHTADPALEFDPPSFHGRLTAINVTYHPANMVIEKETRQTELIIESNAEGQLSPFLINAVVMPMPSPFMRYVVRPLVSMLSGILCGIVLGCLLGLLHFAMPFGSILPSPILSSGLFFWILCLGILWGLIGLIRGFRQHPAWPIAYAAGKWLLRSAAWTVLLFACAVLGAWSLNRFGAIHVDLSLPGLLLIGVLTGAFSVIPATSGEIASARDEAVENERKQHPLKFFKTAEIGPALAALFLIGSSFLGQSFKDRTSFPAKFAGESVIEKQAFSLENKLNDTVDQFLLNYYDRRSPPVDTSESNGMPHSNVSRANLKQMIDQFFSGIRMSIAEFYYNVIEEKPMPINPTRNTAK